MQEKETEEKRCHSSGTIPFSYYESRIPDYFANVPLHWHGEFEINYIRSGMGEFIGGDEKLICKEGDIILMMPNVLHGIYPCGNHALLYDTIVCRPAMLGVAENDRCTAECMRPIMYGSMGACIQITKSSAGYENIQCITEEIFVAAKTNTAQADMLLKSSLLKFFWLLLQKDDISFKPVENSRSELMRPALEYISEHFCEPLTVTQLAERVHLSKSYFMERFRETAGVSVMEYIIRLRVQKACELLTTTEKTAAETAFECGFCNLSNYNRQFKRIMGITPNAYRKGENHAFFTGSAKCKIHSF